MILESLVTTTDSGGAVNLAPMGPRVDADLASFSDVVGTAMVLRPFEGTKTFRNLIGRRRAVVHVTDDAGLFARSAVDAIDPEEVIRRVRQLDIGDYWVLRECHRWFAVDVTSVSPDRPRADVACRVIATGGERFFFGFNRAKHAVIEAAILATRTHLIPAETLWEELERLAPLIEKTGGPAESVAFDFLRKTIDERLARS